MLLFACNKGESGSGALPISPVDSAAAANGDFSVADRAAASGSAAAGIGDGEETGEGRGVRRTAIHEPVTRGPSSL